MALAASYVSAATQDDPTVSAAAQDDPHRILRFHRSSRWPSLHPTSPQHLKMTLTASYVSTAAQGDPHRPAQSSSGLPRLGWAKPTPANPTSPSPAQSTPAQASLAHPLKHQPQPEPQATHCLHLKFQQRHSSTPVPAQLRSGPGPARAQLAHWSVNLRSSVTSTSAQQAPAQTPAPDPIPTPALGPIQIPIPAQLQL